MASSIQRRRGTTSDHSTFTGAVGEITIDTTKDTVVVHDGAVVGGVPLLREDGSNSSLALGSQGVPSLKFSGDPNTGIYSPGADQLAVATNGTRRLLIDSAGALTLDTGDATIYGVRVGRGASAISTNTVVGNDALTAITTGGLNTAMGGNALKANTDGIQNTAVGYNALIANTSGSYNTAYGLNALINNTTGSNNTCIGNPAGTSLTTGSNNTIIGCAVGAAGLADTVIIAAGATERLRITSTNTLNFVGAGTAGSTQTVSLSGSAPVNSLVLDSSGRLGIGTSSPGQNITVQSSASGTAPTFKLQNPVDSNSAQEAANNLSAGQLLFGATGAFPLTAKIESVYDASASFGRSAKLIISGANGAGTLTERVAIDVNGRVGIGTTSPSELLHVAGTIRIGAVPGTNTNAALPVLFQTSAGNIDGGSGLTYNPGGDVFSVGGNAISAGAFSGAGNLGTLTCANGSGQYDFRATNDSLRFIAGSSEAGRFDSSGRLLVGTTSDANGGQVEAKTAIVVSGNPAYGKKAFIAQIPYATTNITSSLLAGFDGNIHGVDLGYRYNGTGYDLCFATNSTISGSPTERMRISSSGLVSITGELTSNGKIATLVPAAVTSFSAVCNAGDQTATSLLLTSSRTDVFYHIQAFNGVTTECFRVEANGNTKNTNNSYGALSDAKIKENIVDATPKLVDLMQVKVRNYNLIGETTKQIGVVAQELESVFPAMVDENADRDENGNLLTTTTKGVKYSVFVPILIKALQEAVVKIESLEARLTAAGL